MRFKLTLKWRFTLLVICLVTLASIVVVASMNLNIGRTLPSTAATIMDIADTGKPIVGENIEPQPSLEAYQGVMQTAASTIYMDSIWLLIIIIFLGGVSAYLIANQALKPVQALNEKIQTINGNNWSTNLEVQGPHDEIKELTISFNQMIAKLNNAFVSQKRFNASVAHELKTPLAAIKTNIDVLNDGEEKTVQEYQATLDIVEKSIGKMNSMIETLLDLVKEENAALNDKIELERIIEEVIEDLTVIGENNEVTLEYAIQTPISEIKGNEILLYRAIYNLVENAIKYNKSQGQVSVSCKQKQDVISIEVNDTGKGISKESINHIFDPFYRGESFNTDRINGMGLGLSFVKSTIHLHGGEIQVWSEVDKGTRMIVNLPVVEKLV